MFVNYCILKLNNIYLLFFLLFVYYYLVFVILKRRYYSLCFNIIRVIEDVGN